jgi:DNA-binding transcriptional ArsR family regulator
MVLDSEARLDLVFHALAHPARRAIVRSLSQGERNLSELAAPLKMTFPAASKHVRVLEQARLVHRRVAGRQHICKLHAAPLKQATDWTEQFRAHWESNFRALDELLEEMKADQAAAESSMTDPTATHPAPLPPPTPPAHAAPRKRRPSAEGRGEGDR